MLLVGCSFVTCVLGSRLCASIIFSSMFCAMAWFCGLLFPSKTTMYSVTAVSWATFVHVKTREKDTQERENVSADAYRFGINV